MQKCLVLTMQRERNMKIDNRKHCSRAQAGCASRRGRRRGRVPAEEGSLERVAMESPIVRADARKEIICQPVHEGALAHWDQQISEGIIFS